MARRANTVSYGNSLENYPHAGQVNSLPICSLAYFPATAMLHIGCHLSSAKGYEATGRVALSISANTFQFFTRNPRGSKAKAIDEQDIARFLELARNNGFGTLLAHAPYTLNPCSADPGVARFAAQVLKEDLELMEHLPGNLYNFHPGCHVGQGAEKGIELVAGQLNGVLSPEQTTIVLLETMSGKGSEVGRTFEELAAIMERVDLKDKLGVCLDTCHVYSAGYDIVNGLDSVLEHFDAVLGLERLRAIHLEHLPGNLYNFHPGCHVGQGAEKGIELVAGQLNGVLSPEQTTIVLLETMSGKGSEVGRTFEELAAIMERVDLKDKLGVCLDTCHVYSAGYDIVNGLDSVLEHFDAVLGLERLRAIHLNDSMTPFSSFKDRHETIGKGSLGEQAFINIINHPVLRELPFFLETPRDDAGHGEEITWLKEHYRN